MSVPPHLLPFWNEFLLATGTADHGRYYDVCIFGDSEKLADELANLVLRGVKRQEVVPPAVLCASSMVRTTVKSHDPLLAVSARQPSVELAISVGRSPVLMN